MVRKIKGKAITAWLVRDRVGKMRRAIFFCGKEYVPADERHEVVRCKVKFEIVRADHGK